MKEEREHAVLRDAKPLIPAACAPSPPPGSPALVVVRLADPLILGKSSRMVNSDV